MAATAIGITSQPDPRTTTRSPSLAELRRLFAPFSKGTQDLADYWKSLKGVQPGAPDYVWWHLARFVKTLHFLTPLMAGIKEWLDVGSDPWFCLLGERKFPGVKLVPTAMTEESQAFHDENGKDHVYHPLPLVIDSTDSFSAPGNYDMVTAFEVLEHLPFHPAPFFAGLNRALRNGGKVVLSTPNGSSWTTMNLLLDGACPYQTYRFGGPMTHRAEYTIWEVKTLLESSGFRVERIRTCNMYPNDCVGLRAWAMWLCAVMWHAASFQVLRVRNLLLRSGSTMLVYATKVGACDPADVVRV
jgi:SAM-dependent methyltransferase